MKAPSRNSTFCSHKWRWLPESAQSVRTLSGELSRKRNDTNAWNRMSSIVCGAPDSQVHLTKILPNSRWKWTERCQWVFKGFYTWHSHVCPTLHEHLALRILQPKFQLRCFVLLPFRVALKYLTFNHRITAVPRASAIFFSIILYATRYKVPRILRCTSRCFWTGAFSFTFSMQNWDLLLYILFCEALCRGQEPR